MRDDQPSRTADRVAVRRAAHQVWDDPRVFDDPLALKIISPESVIEISGEKGSDSLPARSLRAFVAVRSRFAEDRLAAAVAGGVRQYVVLGAGLDTFACRNPFPDLHVFEVDYPATQVWKRERLTASGIPLPASMTFVPVNFEKDTLAGALARAGFRGNEPAFFSWLGVVPYLAEATVLSTLQWIASSRGETGVAFDYAVPRSSLDPIHRVAFDRLASRVAAAGEPFVTFFDPATLADQLLKMGFRHIEDLGAEQINARYFNRRSDGLELRGKLGRLMCASRLTAANEFKP